MPQAPEADATADDDDDDDDDDGWGKVEQWDNVSVAFFAGLIRHSVVVHEDSGLKLKLSTSVD